MHVKKPKVVVLDAVTTELKVLATVLSKFEETQGLSERITREYGE